MPEEIKSYWTPADKRRVKTIADELHRWADYETRSDVFRVMCISQRCSQLQEIITDIISRQL